MHGAKGELKREFSCISDLSLLELQLKVACFSFTIKNDFWIYFFILKQGVYV